MTSILIVGIVQAIFLCLLVLNKKNKGRSDYVLLTLLVYSALHLVFFLANFNDDLNPDHNLLIIGSGFPLLYGPMLYWYVISLIYPNHPQWPSFLLHGAPFLLYCLSFLYFYNVLSPELIQVYDGFMHACCGLPWLMRNYSIFFALSGGGYPTVSIILLALHKRKIKDQFSYDDQINLVWLRNIILFTIFSFVISFISIYLITGKTLDFEPRYAFYIVSSISTVFIFFMGYFGLRQPHIFTNKQTEIHSGRYEKSGLDNTRSQAILGKLQDYMHREQPYLNSKLSLNDLATKMEVSSNHLSQAINENLGKNFFDFVNEYRVEEVKKRLSDPEFSHFTLLGIGLDSGFSSKSSFNHIFKKVTGKTPSEFKKNLTK